MQKRCNKIYKDFLRIVDSELYDYMIKIDIDATIFLVYYIPNISRWLKCILNREFHHANVILIWDTILSNDLKESQEIHGVEKIHIFNLNMLDFLCVSMISYLREESII